jgi:hypothetical protein
MAFHPHPTAARLTPEERLLLFCLASGSDWQAASITHATAEDMLMRGLVERAGDLTSYKLTDPGRAVLAAVVDAVLAEESNEGNAGRNLGSADAAAENVPLPRCHGD